MNNFIKILCQETKVKSLKNIKEFISNNKKMKILFLFIISIALLLLSRHVFADDVLANTDRDVKDTITGTGKTWLYVLEFVIASGTGIKTRNIYAFFGILAVAIFIDVFVQMAWG